MRSIVLFILVAGSLCAIPQIASAQINMNSNAAPYCLQSSDGSGNCSFQTYYDCKSAGPLPNTRCIQNPYAAANRTNINRLTVPRTSRRR